MAMSPQGQIDPETIKTILEMSGDDLELQAMLKQYAMSDALRGTALGGGSKNAYGAVAQALAGYGAGQQEQKFRGSMTELGGKKRTGRGKFFEAMFPGATQAEPMETGEGVSDEDILRGNY